MGYRFATMGLGPLLLLQGRRLRREVPRLPEPDGDRHGTQGEGPPLRLLVVGDSAAAGVGASHQGDALSGQLVATLAQDFHVSWRLIGRTGLTVHELLDRLHEEPEAPFDIAIVSIGVNDVTAGTAAKAWQPAVDALMQLLAVKFAARYIQLSGIAPMQQFPALPQPLAWYLGQRAARLNRISGQVLATREGCEFVPFQMPREPGLFAHDGFHPSPLGYSLWAGHLAGVARRRWCEIAHNPVPSQQPG